jgi:hypothetical protein
MTARADVTPRAGKVGPRSNPGPHFFERAPRSILDGLRITGARVGAQGGRPRLIRDADKCGVERQSGACFAVPVHDAVVWVDFRLPPDRRPLSRSRRPCFDETRSRQPRLLLENSLHDAGADAELLADLENAITVGPQLYYSRLHRGLNPAPA